MNEMFMNKRISVGVIAALLYFVVLAFLFIPECDDLYFQYWDFADMKDFILTIPLQSDAAGVPQNGRYMGNALGIALAKLYDNDLKCFRALFIGLCMWLFCVLAAKEQQSKSSRSRFIFAFAVLVFAPTCIWQNVMSWAASFCNYFIPILILFVYRMLRMDEGSFARNAVIFCLALLAQMFSETVSVFFLVFGCLFALKHLMGKNQSGFYSALSIVIGAALGAIIMFSDPGYDLLGNDPVGRSFGISKAFTTFFDALSITVFENVLLFPISAVLFYRYYRNDSRTWVRVAVLGMIGFAFVFTPLSVSYRMGFAVSAYVRVLFCLFGLVLLLLLWCGMKCGDAKRWIGLWMTCFVVMTGILMVVNPVSPRHMFLNYTLLFMAMLELSREVDWFPNWVLLGLSVITAIHLMYVYHANFNLNEQRVAMIVRAMNEKQSEITLPLVPYPDYTVNEKVGKGDVSFVYYYEHPWDMKFTFVEN